MKTLTPETPHEIVAFPPGDTPVQTLLRKALALLDDGRGWTKGTMCKHVSQTRCSMGALFHVAGDLAVNGDAEGALGALAVAARKLGRKSPADLNDRAVRFAEVRIMFNLAIAEASAGPTPTGPVAPFVCYGA